MQLEIKELTGNPGKPRVHVVEGWTAECLAKIFNIGRGG